jgi:hypothetical protein
MKTHKLFSTFLLAIAVLFLAVIIGGCEKNSLQELTPDQNSTYQRLDIGWDELLKTAKINMNVTPRGHGYVAEARGRGTIPSGEYAGQRFQILMEGEYSDIGMSTLISGEVLVTIRGERFESVIDPSFPSFCCGEGHLEFIDGEYTFVMYGYVNHSTADEPHPHLFAGLATTAGTMNMNIADQTGTVVEPLDSPHDPGIGEVFDFDAQYVRVELH